MSEANGKVKEKEQTAPAQPEELKNLSYELLLIGLSLLSVFNVFLLIISTDPVVIGVINIIDVPLTVIFFVDFVIRLRSAESRTKYFFRQFGWADLAASLPFPALKILRLFRVFRAWRMISRYGARNLARQVGAHRADAALSVIFFLILCVLEFGGMLVVVAERGNPDANIKTASDAVWWAFVSITTVGYGDRFPVTNWGRVVGTFVLTTGVGLFGVLTGYLANAFLGPSKEQEEKDQMPQPPETQLDSRAVLGEMQRLLAENEKTQLELRELVAELKQGSPAGRGG